MNAAEKIAEATRGTQWENRLYLVGGAVRDPLLGLPSPQEIDILVDGDALEFGYFLREKGISSIEPVTYPRFGTALVMVNHSKVELASPRRESYDPQSRKPDVVPATLEEDALRRDFTINALFKNLHTGDILDFTGRGLEDIKHKILRTPLEPAATFRDDPLRMLRAVRFKNQLSLSYAPGLTEAIKQERDRLEIVSMERIQEELTKMLSHPSAAECLEELMDFGLLPKFIPELEEGIGVEQGTYHTKDVWEHTLDVVRNAAHLEIPDSHQKYLIVLGALFHDIAKPRTKSIDEDGRIRFFEHERVGGEMTYEIMKRLKFPKADCDSVAKLVRNHMRLGSAPTFTASAARKLIRDMGELTEPLLLLCEADARAVGKIPKGIDFDAIRKKIAEVQTEIKEAGLTSPLNGEEIMQELGITEGPEVGKWKRVLEQAVLEGEIPPGDKAAARSFLHEAYKKSLQSNTST
ncbi:MAG TPA: CCA tRNA nucleotidyltransferase [Fimbriimonadales bacterium]|nr:CCA tRNA nucleotidyltransferase [Fimbriimonadales bacterium]